MKIRILNGGHAAIAYPAGLLDIHFVHEAMEDKQIATFLETLTEARDHPVVPPPPGVVLEAYRSKVAERFANPKIGDTVTRLCLDGSNRQPKFILPTVARPARAGASVKGLALVSALWCRYCYGESESGKVIPPNDPSWDRLQAAAKPRGPTLAPSSPCATFLASSRTTRPMSPPSRALGSPMEQGRPRTLDDYLNA